MFLAIASPSPVRCWSSLVEKNGSKTLEINSGLMPQPVSRTRRRTCSASESYAVDTNSCPPPPTCEKPHDCTPPGCDETTDDCGPPSTCDETVEDCGPPSTCDEATEDGNGPLSEGEETLEAASLEEAEEAAGDLADTWTRESFDNDDFHGVIREHEWSEDNSVRAHLVARLQTH